MSAVFVVIPTSQSGSDTSSQSSEESAEKAHTYYIGENRVLCKRSSKLCRLYIGIYAASNITREAWVLDWNHPGRGTKYCVTNSINNEQIILNYDTRQAGGNGCTSYMGYHDLFSLSFVVLGLLVRTRTNCMAHFFITQSLQHMRFPSG